MVCLRARRIQFRKTRKLEFQNKFMHSSFLVLDMSQSGSPQKSVEYVALPDVDNKINDKLKNFVKAHGLVMNGSIDIIR